MSSHLMCVGVYVYICVFAGTHTHTDKASTPLFSQEQPLSNTPTPAYFPGPLVLVPGSRKCCAQISKRNSDERRN